MLEMHNLAFVVGTVYFFVYLFSSFASQVSGFAGDGTGVSNRPSAGWRSTVPFCLV